MKLNLFVVLIFITGILVTPLTLSSADLDQMKLDKHMKTLAVHLKNKEYSAAAEIFTKTDKLIAGHRLTLHRGYYFYKAEVMYHTNRLTFAIESLEKYLMLTGRTGCYYDRAMQLQRVLKQTAVKERVEEENMVVAERTKAAND